MNAEWRDERLREQRTWDRGDGCRRTGRRRFIGRRRRLQARVVIEFDPASQAVGLGRLQGAEEFQRRERVDPGRVGQRRWEALGGSIVGSPGVMVDGNDLRVFAAGADGTPWQYHFDGTWRLLPINTGKIT